MADSWKEGAVLVRRMVSHIWLRSERRYANLGTTTATYTPRGPSPVASNHRPSSRCKVGLRGGVPDSASTLCRQIHSFYRPPYLGFVRGIAAIRWCCDGRNRTQACRGSPSVQ